LLESFAPEITIRDPNESESVCHASAIRAREPLIIPAQSFKPNNAVFPIIEIAPYLYAARVRFILG
jgi:hypothetical protein